ncbi:F-BAR domain only protein 2-like [Schistocerca americana]|uniref:F-BAR domain only protein 2-like n=1 Tax=Schistocerca americana TaxID=7009 RepID=UPI001F4FB62F|nr:F-BAR domain only protein 2-like [Schistocerca americana]XP_047103644.1 F-BAR domain only protein 2-like [Schistocerca piceifrons]XP_049844710.1 F-BAR domain only protein 2 isoform X6 [Schistocerca gregaria]XP_049954425.1 F-BAR domain only protein 2-like isoform X2 [Schistocerca serialis cubense]
MTVDFGDYFWGEKNNGFTVLYQNMKHGLVASKEFADFLRERSNIEENNSKLLAKLAKQTSSGSVQGTFAPVWQVLRSSAEKLSNLHMQMVQKVTELVKEVSKYAEELHKKHKLVKEEEGSTLEVVQAIQSTTLILQKAKDTYTQRGLEYEKLKKENASPKDLEKAEIKLKKAQEEYKALIEKYKMIKEEFERKMILACRHFQEIEEAHVKQMKEFLNTYADDLQHNHDLIGQIHIDFKRQCLEMTVEKLLEQFVLTKYTGLERPCAIEFEEFSISGLSSITSQAQDSSEKTTNGEKPSKKEGFLRSRREKRKEKKAKKKKDGMDNTSSKEEKSDVKNGSLDASREDKDDNRKSETPTPEVDEEGYCIKPKPDPWENDKGSFYSSSDTDSDDEREHKIHVEIKPLSNGSAPMSASVDELRATVENLSLSPVATVTARRDSAADPDSHIKRSQSVSQQLGGKPSSDLLGLNLFQSPTASSASTPTGNHPYAPLHSPTQPTVSSPAPSTSSSRYADLGDLFSEVGEMQQPALPPKQSRQTPTPTQGTIAIPRPPSRRGEGPSTRGRMSPAPIARADSVGSLEFRTAGVPVGSSRGPSPLTIGMADTIPLAVAFHEIVHSYFRGTDETKCQVKLSGDMMLSFPAGIVAVLANNPSPAQLSFRIRNTHRLEDMLPNKQLVTIDSAQSSHDSTVFDFNMNALTALLRRQSDQNPSASYFNVDILKYKIKPKSGAGSCPFQLVAYWKCESSHTDLRIDYKYNSHAMSSASPLLNLTVAVPVDGGVKNMQSKPNAQWQPENNRALWKFTELSQHSENHGVGSLRARLEVTNGPSNQSTIATQFNCEGTTLSGLEFELVGAGYRLSLVKRRFVSGKYICDGDPDPRNRYATPPGSEC